MRENQEPNIDENANNTSVPNSTPRQEENNLNQQVAKPLNTVDLTKENIDIEEPVNLVGINQTMDQPGIAESNPVGGGVPSVDNENGVSQVYIPEPEKKKLSSKAIASIVIALVVIGAIVFGVFYFLNRPKITFLNTVNKSYNELMEEYNDLKTDDLNENIKKQAVELINHFDVNLSTNDPNYRTIANVLNNVKLDISYGLDMKNKQALFNFDLKSSGALLFNENYFLKDTESYVQFKNLFSKYIKMDTPFFAQELFTLEISKDLDYVLRTIKDELLDELKDSDFDKTKEELSINGKTVKTKKLTLNLDANRISEIRDVVIDSLINNEKFISAWINLTGKTESDVTKALKEYKTKELSLSLLKIDVYVDGDKAIQYVINTKDETSDNIISISDYNDYSDITVKEEGRIIFAITDKDDVTLINVGSATIEIAKQDDENYDFTIKSGMTKMNGTILIKEKEISTTQTEVTETITLNLDSASRLVITSTISQKMVDKITPPDITNSVNLENLTENDANTIISNLLNNKELNRILAMFGGNTTQLQ